MTLPRLSRLPHNTMSPNVQVRLMSTVSTGSSIPRHERKQANNTPMMIRRASGNRVNKSRCIVRAE